MTFKYKSSGLGSLFPSQKTLQEVGSVRPEIQNESAEIPRSQRFSDMAREMGREEAVRRAERVLKDIQSSTKHQILFPTLKDSLARLNNPMVKQKVEQLAHASTKSEFDEIYLFFREVSHLWLIGLADFLNKKRIKLDFLAAGRPDIKRKNGYCEEQKWIIVNCTRESLDSVSPKVQVVPAQPDSINRTPKEIDLYDVFASNDFF